MLRKVHQLDFDAIIGCIERATDPATRTACDSLLQADLSFVRTRPDALELVRNYILLAALDHATSLDDVRFEDPLIEAAIRVQHHPDAKPLARFPVEAGAKGPDASPRLNALVASHPELTWSVDDIQELVVQAIRTHGEHELDDDQPPWFMYWGPASGAAYALRVLVTLRRFGDL